MTLVSVTENHVLQSALYKAIKKKKEKNVYLYTAHITSWRFTILLSEIGRQLVKAPLAAAISPYLI